MTTRQRNIFWTTVRMVFILALIGVLLTHGNRHGQVHGSDDTSSATEKNDSETKTSKATEPEHPADESDAETEKASTKKEPADSGTNAREEADASAGGAARSPDRLAAVTIFVLAIFVGFEVITKVPPTLHTPLMSGSNAVSGITVVGAIIVAGQQGWLSSWLGMLAVALAMVNVVGGFLVTHRMLAMFKKR